MENTESLGRLPFVRSDRSDQSALKWNTRVLRTGSDQNGPAHGSERLSSSAPSGQSAGVWKVVAGKIKRASLGPFHLNWNSTLASCYKDISNVFTCQFEQSFNTFLVSH